MNNNKHTNKQINKVKLPYCHGICRGDRSGKTTEGSKTGKTTAAGGRIGSLKMVTTKIRTKSAEPAMEYIIKHQHFCAERETYDSNRAHH